MHSLGTTSVGFNLGDKQTELINFILDTLHRAGGIALLLFHSKMPFTMASHL